MPTHKREAGRGKALSEAAALSGGDRQRDYGSLDDNFGRIKALLDVMAPHLASLTLADLQLIMVATKLARNAKRYKRDSIIDAINYLDFYAAFKECEANDTSAIDSETQPTPPCPERAAGADKEYAEQLTATTESGWFIQRSIPIGRNGIRLVIGIDPGRIGRITHPYEVEATKAFKALFEAWECAANASRDTVELSSALGAVERLTSGGFRPGDAGTLGQALLTLGDIKCTTSAQQFRLDALRQHLTTLHGRALLACHE